MEKLLTDFYTDIREMALNLLWSQWATVGAPAAIQKFEGYTVDPEALIMATMSFGRYDARVFDEAVCWMAKNSSLINANRLKTMSEKFRDKTNLVMGATLDYLYKDGLKKFQNKDGFWEKFKTGDKEELFITTARVGNTEKCFDDWGLLRGLVRRRELAVEPDLTLPENVIFRLRKFAGVSTRADSLYHLLFKQDNARQTSIAISHNQSGTNRVLQEMADAGVLIRVQRKRENVFYLDSFFKSFFKVNNIKYLLWSDIFSAIEIFTEDPLDHPEEYKSEYLTQSRLIDISKVISGKFFDGGLIVPPPGRNQLPKYIKDCFTDILPT
jgi:hypothetical protein